MIDLIAGLGMVIAFLVICTLVEISLSYFEVKKQYPMLETPLFSSPHLFFSDSPCFFFQAVLFGCILVLLGSFILARTLCATDDAPEGGVYRSILGGFAVLVIVSGMCCFALQENWHKSLSVHAKVPIYFLLGTTLSFSIIFGMGDIVNICGTR